MEERWQAAAKSPAVRSLFSDTVQMKEEPSSPVQNTQTQVPAIEEKQEDRDAAGNQPPKDDDILDEEILDEGRQLTLTDNYASPEDSDFLGFEYTGEQTDKMVLSPPDHWKKSSLLQSQPQTSDLHPKQQHLL